MHVWGRNLFCLLSVFNSLRWHCLLWIGAALSSYVESHGKENSNSTTWWLRNGKKNASYESISEGVLSMGKHCGEKRKSNKNFHLLTNETFANIETDGAKWFLQHIKVLKLNLNRDGYTRTQPYSQWQIYSPRHRHEIERIHTQIPEYISHFLHRIKLNIT